MEFFPNVLFDSFSTRGIKFYYMPLQGEENTDCDVNVPPFGNDQHVNKQALKEEC